MKKRLNLTIDSELYDALENLPRKVSVSEIVNFILRGVMLQLVKGRLLTDEEVEAEVQRAGGEEFRQRLAAFVGPTNAKIEFGMEKIKELFTLNLGREPEKAK